MSASNEERDKLTCIYAQARTCFGTGSLAGKAASQKEDFERSVSKEERDRVRLERGKGQVNLYLRTGDNLFWHRLPRRKGGLSERGL